MKNKNNLAEVVLSSGRKYCGSCKTLLPIEQYHKNKHKKDGLSSWCSKCSAASIRKWYKSNRSRRNKQIHLRRLGHKQRLIKHFGDKCLDCRVRHPACVYDFHHLDPTKKDMGFGFIGTCSWDTIEKEIVQKCVMLCANCHRIRHRGC